MQPLSVMLNACAQALRHMKDDTSDAWHAAYCAAVDPESVLELAIIVKCLIEYIEENEGSTTLTESVKTRMGTQSTPNSN